MRGLAYSGADLFIIAFSVIDRASFDNAIKKVILIKIVVI
jgi:hypothetical protein